MGHEMITEMHKLFADDDLEIVQYVRRYILPSILASPALSNRLQNNNPIDSPKSSTLDLYMYLVFNKKPILS